MGDPNGIGPEIIARCWPDTPLHQRAKLVVIGCSQTLRRALALIASASASSVAPANASSSFRQLKIEQIGQANLASPTALGPIDPSDQRLLDVDWSRTHPSPTCMPVIDIGLAAPTESLAEDGLKRPVWPAATAGTAAATALQAATHLALAGQVQAIVTAPLNKKSLNSAGMDVPGHTELLANYCNIQNVAMMLYLPASEKVAGPLGLSIVHTTLHCSLKSAVAMLSTDLIREKIELTHNFVSSLADSTASLPRIAVAALNPHGGEQGIFGDEEQTLIRPAVEACRQQGLDCHGPLPVDTLFRRAAQGEFDAVVAMYHDQGHIAVKLLDMFGAVNITLGLPIIRTSVAHGTADEIAWRSTADPRSLRVAIDVAIRLAANSAARQARVH